MFRKFLNLLPFLILLSIAIYASILFLTTQYVLIWRNHLAFALLTLNGVLYFFDFKRAVLMTGVLLILSTFNVIVFFPWVSWSQLKIIVTLPKFYPFMLGLFVLYFLLNFSLLMNWYLDVKEARQRVPR